MKHLAVIPFTGFYYSEHSVALDYEMEQLMTDSSGCHPISDKLATEFHFEAGYSNGMLADYARWYVDAWRDAAGIACEFESVHSPREYNFTTDRIFVHIETAELHRLYDGVDKGRMTIIAQQRHTSRSGFISYYDNDWQSWGEVETWEPEQIHTLILASLPEDYPEGEYELMERAISNGRIAAAVWGNLSDKARRLANIATYLRERDERKYRRG